MAKVTSTAATMAGRHRHSNLGLLLLVILLVLVQLAGAKYTPSYVDDRAVSVFSLLYAYSLTISCAILSSFSLPCFVPSQHDGATDISIAPSCRSLRGPVTGSRSLRARMGRTTTS